MGCRRSRDLHSWNPARLRRVRQFLGFTYAYRLMQAGIDAAIYEANRRLVDYTGGNVGDRFGKSTPGRRARQLRCQIELVLPRLSARWNGLATADWWPGNTNWLRRHSYWQVGQRARFASIEGQQEATAGEGVCRIAAKLT
jgi:hypothetical protein